LALAEKEEHINMLTRRLESMEEGARSAEQENDSLKRQLARAADSVSGTEKQHELQEDCEHLNMKLERSEKILATYRDQLAERSKLESQYQEAVDDLEAKLREARGQLDGRQREVEDLRADAAASRSDDLHDTKHLFEAQDALAALQKRNEELASSVKASQDTVHALEEVNEQLHTQTENLRKERADLLEKHAKLARNHSDSESRNIELQEALQRRSHLDSSRTIRQSIGDHYSPLPGITAQSGSTRIASLATNLNEHMQRPPLESSGVLDEEIQQLAELLEAASQELQSKSDEVRAAKNALQTQSRNAERSEASLAETEAHRDELVQRCRMLEVENAVAVEQLTRSGMWNGQSTAPGLPPRPGTPSAGTAQGPMVPGRSTYGRPQSPSSYGRPQSPSRRSASPRARSPITSSRARTPPQHRHRSPGKDRFNTYTRNDRGDPKAMTVAVSLVQEMVEALCTKFEENGLLLPLERVNNEVYRLGNRKLSLKVQNERLVVRVGGGFCDLIEFLEKVRI